MQHISVCCNRGDFEPHLVPVFIRLKEFCEYGIQKNISLLEYIELELKDFKINSDLVSNILEYGRMLLLLDGLDEVADEQLTQKVAKEIISFCEKYFKNKFIITCRTAAIGEEFSNFCYVEIADFTDLQIKEFSKNWFTAVDRCSEEQGEYKVKTFLEHLNREDNQPIKELVVIPILLSLACLVFQVSNKFPKNRSGLYKNALDILLKKWDATKRIDRDEVYHDI